MNRKAALQAMFAGQIVRGHDGLFLTGDKHGGHYLYRWNDEFDQLQRYDDIKQEWRPSKNSFWLTDEFSIE